MIRWYDYIIAVVTADLLIGGFLLAANGPTFWHQLGGGLFLGLVWDFWNSAYCRVRYAMEKQRE